MDEMDHIQELALAQQEAMLRDRMRRAELEKQIKPPESRECDSCGCDIPAARLKIKPLTRYCVDCQEELEKPGR